MTEKEKGASKELVDYFIEQTNERFSILESKMDQLLEFKWRVVGGVVAASCLVTMIIQVASLVWRSVYG